MKKRTLAPALQHLCFSDHKIALVSGPRRCGKTFPGPMPILSFSVPASRISA